MKKKFAFLSPSIILAALTLLWLFYKNGRWYTYREEWPFLPLLILHLAQPLYYLISCIMAIIRHFTKSGRQVSYGFYIVASAIMIFVSTIGLFVFLIFTSGA